MLHRLNKEIEMSYLRHVERCNRHNPTDFIPFIADDQLVGRMRPAFAELLRKYADVFQQNGSGITLHSALSGYADRTEALAEVMQQLVADGHHDHLMGEPYPVTAGLRHEALFEIDRTASSLFGLRTFGQHINGFVKDGDELLMWVAKRASDKRTFPGMLDQLVAGGLPMGINLQENLQKECYEEAGIPETLANQAVPVGAISYNVDNVKGYKYDILYCYDLLLPENFTPVCTDGEVDEFMLQPMAEVMSTIVETDRFKPNCNLVVIDFLLRHGYISPEHGEYLDLITGLRPAMRTSFGTETII